MMAEEMKGPMKELVLPMMEKREKKRNSLPRGVTSEIIWIGEKQVSGEFFLLGSEKSGVIGCGDDDDK